jgi:hypothetical protein
MFPSEVAMLGGVRGASSNNGSISWECVLKRELDVLRIWTPTESHEANYYSPPNLKMQTKIK